MENAMPHEPVLWWCRECEGLAYDATDCKDLSCIWQGKPMTPLFAGPGVNVMKWLEVHGEAWRMDGQQAKADACEYLIRSWKREHPAGRGREASEQPASTTTPTEPAAASVAGESPTQTPAPDVAGWLRRKSDEFLSVTPKGMESKPAEVSRFLAVEWLRDHPAGRGGKP